jgi:hypothetical protein
MDCLEKINYTVLGEAVFEAKEPLYLKVIKMA